MHVVELLEKRFADALFGMVDDPAAFAGLIKPTKDDKHGDYQANLAMSVAKQLNRKPREVANELVRRLQAHDLVETPEIAGPGFINLRLRREWLADQMQALFQDQRLGITPVAQPKRFVIDFSSPNVAKPMHVGHLRSTIIGDALTRLLRFMGHQVITDNHLGDWGTQFGMLIYGWKHNLDREALQRDPVQEMVRLYLWVREQIKLAGAAAEGEEEEAANPVAEACRRETAKLHAGDLENTQLWQRMMPWCQAELNRIYRRLDIHFDHTLGESHYNPQLAGVVNDLIAKGIAQESKGAYVVFFGENEPPALIRKRDGAFTYMTTDLATIRHRVEEWKAQTVLYVVDARQALHFQQLFATAKRWGYQQTDFVHIVFGSVLGQDGKPIKTREGGAIELQALLNEAVERAAQIIRDNSPELSKEEQMQVAEAVGIGAVKYADLSQNRSSDYVFSWDKMLAMNGNTGAYMQYACARVRSIFRKGGLLADAFRQQVYPIHINHPQERQLALALLRFPEALQQAVQDYRPNAITSYLWDLAKPYSSFFDQCPVLKADTEAMRNSRLVLCDLTARVLQQGLALLGIQTPERM